MRESVYTVRWILNLDDPDRPGVFGTTNHLGASPAAAAIASAQSVSSAVKDCWGRAQLHILRVSDPRGERNLLSSGDLQTALARAHDTPPIDILCRPLC